MRKIILTAMLAAGLALIPSQASATVRDDGNEWLEGCNGGTHGKEMWCLGYTQAISHSYDVLAAVQENDYYCAGKRTVTIGQLRDMMRSYLYRNPAKRSDAMMLIYIRTMQEAFPCK